MSHHGNETKDADELTARTGFGSNCSGPLSDADARAIRAQLRKKRAGAAKQSLARRAPLRTANTSRTAAGAGDRRAELLAALEAAERLPLRSAYARHRRACLEKALQLLDLERCAAQARCLL